MKQEQNIEKIKKLAASNADVDVLWLYGSRARSQAQENSDYDLAVAFKNYVKDPVERRLRPELLALEWQKQLGFDLSIIDINQAALPMAYTIVQDNVTLFCSDDYRRMVEEQRIMSKWELDHLHHRKYYA